MSATQAGHDPVMSALRADFEQKHSRAGAIIADPKATPEQLVEAKRLTDELPALQQRIEAHRRVKGQLDASGEWAATPARTLPFAGSGGGRAPAVPRGPDGKSYRIDAGDSEVDKRMMTGGFKSLGHLAWCMVKRGRDGRGEPSAVEAVKSWGDLRTKAPSGMFEESDPDGGDLIPPQFSNQIYERAVAKNQILAYLNPITLVGNTLEIPVLKENSRADGSRGGGVLGYWQGEADQYTKSKPQYSKRSLKLHKLTVLVYTTEELLNDSPIAIDSEIGRRASNEVNFKLNDAVINGGGNGMPLGVMNSNSKITVTAVSGQGANTFVYQNVLGLFARIVAGQRADMLWLYNQDVEPQLFGLFMPTGTTGVAVFTPNQDGGFNLMGRRTLVMEQCQSLGTAGDVIAFAPQGYTSIIKGGLQSFMSMHLRFDFDEMVFKFRFRFDGQPYDDVPLTPFKGSNTVSSIAVLNSTRT